ncbi:hypothetical protein DFA_04701 [Cavenderia fasciculata]|uniref:CBS domain-containing protein n=1 Tax=Cavenderia fasciculata TaxID=261658 RepID=F4PQA8_CACFS|nr:uncharacterized protein DFA_04701 [Cavenderia fasciculata]EGG22571.1 hypothetical protein DFA_04701 [Cavenderia fasciculata]|eukprot:XP_004360422.1 hypothetical protein DFA_04701 [Cavenderia fasciculata]
MTTTNHSNDFLYKTTINDMLNTENDYWRAKRERHIISVPHDQTLAETVKILSKNKILSIPVMDEQNDFLGFVDMIDIVYFILGHYLEDKEIHGRGASINWNALCFDIDTVIQRGRGIGMVPIKSLINQSKMDLFIPVDGTGSLHQLLKEVFKKNIHRVIVVNEDASPSGLISQTDMLKFLTTHNSFLGDMLSKSLCDLNLINKKVVTMPSDKISLFGYYLMLQNETYGVAVVDQDKEIIGDISIADLRGIEPQQLSNLLQPAAEFCNKEPITCTSDSSLIGLMQKMVDHKAHRVWVVESNACEKPIGMVSIADLMEFFSHFKIDHNNNNI